MASTGREADSKARVPQFQSPYGMTRSEPWWGSSKVPCSRRSETAVESEFPQLCASPQDSLPFGPAVLDYLPLVTTQLSSELTQVAGTPCSTPWVCQPDPEHTQYPCLCFVSVSLLGCELWESQVASESCHVPSVTPVNGSYSAKSTTQQGRSSFLLFRFTGHRVFSTPYSASLLLTLILKTDVFSS